MANQKPVDEIRIGRVKATIWKQWDRRTAQAQCHLFPPLQRRRSMEEHAELRAQRLVGACESGRPRAYAAVPASDRSRSPGGAGQRLLAVAPGRGGANRFAVLVLFFPRRLSLCLCYLPAHSFAVITLVSYSGLLVSPLSL